MKTSTIAPELTGLERKLKRLKWSAKKRFIPYKEQIIPFDLNLKIAVRPIDRLGRRVWLDGYSDRDLAIILDALLKPGMCYFDIGAHFGQYTLMASKRNGDTGSVHAFEPTKHTFSQLKRNVEINRLKNVSINNCALFNEETELEFHVCNKVGMSEFNSIGSSLRPDDAEVEVVKARTLDGYCAEHKVGAIDFMKIDVEGAELTVLEGGKKLFSSPEAPPLSVEFHEKTCETMGYSTKQLRNMLKGFGYQLYRLDVSDLSLTLEPDQEHYDEVVNLIAVKDVAAFSRKLLG
jgi:FkbM family methyltransferase